jgi:ABC-type antimicrobial peptide transport system permease subunit
MVLFQGLWLASAGVAIGLAASFGLTRLITNLLFGVTPHDPLTFTLIPVLLSVIALIAVWLPARRASRVDPMIAIRQG